MTNILVIMLFSFSGFGEDNNTSKTQIEEEPRFTPHISTEAWTGPKGNFSLQRIGGANLNTTFLLSSLTYAVSDRVEIGTSLINYFVDDHVWNIQIKYNFWRSKHFNWALGFSNASYKFRDESGASNTEVTVDLGGLQFVLNYFPDFTKLRFGLTITQLTDTARNADSNDKLSEINTQELGVDISYPFKEDMDLTLGFGWLRDQGISSDEDRNFGFGLSYRLYVPGFIFSTPTVGIHYTPETDDVNFLISSSLY